MALADYSHYNEEAPMIWWEEEGRHEPSLIEVEDDDYCDRYYDDDVDEELDNLPEEWTQDERQTETNS